MVYIEPAHQIESQSPTSPRHFPKATLPLISIHPSGALLALQALGLKVWIPRDIVFRFSRD
jgi:hypothetical protein